MMVRAAVLAFCLSVSLLAQAPAAGDAARPTLVVILVADQMRADYVDRYPGRFTGGLKRLLEQGAWYTRAAYPYLNTITCAGHSTIATGALPYRHGMILNQWIDRKAGKLMDCTRDPAVTEISYNGLAGGEGDSAKWQEVPTLAELIRRDAKGRTVALSLKPRSAIGLAGHRADVVVWFDDRGGWATSSAFTKKPVPFVQQFVDAHPVPADSSKTWERTLDPAAYQGADDAVGERPPAGWTRSFPHPLGGPSGKSDAGFYTRWQRSPFADEYLGRMAAAAVDELHLGSRAGVDFLGVSFSSLDLVGHMFGPDSHEVQDMVVRLDLTIGALLEHLDRTVGRDKYVLAFSSDHGVGQIPEQVPGAGRVTSAEVTAAITGALQPFHTSSKPVVASAYTDIYLSTDAQDCLKKDRKSADAVLAALRALPGIAQAYERDEIRAVNPATETDPIKRAAALSYYPGRSGDIIIVPRENWILTANAATHGTLYSYDQRVPVILYGAGIKPGNHDEAATPADIEPTLAALIRLRVPKQDGRVLSSALTTPN